MTTTITNTPATHGIYTWNTGRSYSEAGQRIAAVVLPSTGRVAFMDVDRGISGVSRNALPGYSNLAAMTTFLMDEYDHGSYSGNFYDVSEIGSLEDISGFVVKMKLAAKDQMKNETVILYGEPQRAFDPVSPEGYALVMVDAALQLAHQDNLDSYFQSRVIDVRNGLRELGWEGEPYGSLRKDGFSMQFKPVQVGAGANVVGGAWKLLGVNENAIPAKWMSVKEITDKLDKTPVALAADIDTAMRHETARIQGNRLRMPQELTFAEFAEIATLVKLENHGRQWEVMFAGESLGFCDQPTRAGALQEAHSREINNAIYSHTPDAPEFLGRAVFPPANVIAEYPDLRETFADVFKARATLEPVKEGNFSGQVLSVSDGVVTQKINRDGATVRHDAQALSKPVVVGDLVEIKYSSGVGVVGGKGVEAGAALGR